MQNSKAKSDMTFEEARDEASESISKLWADDRLNGGIRKVAATGFTAGARFILESEQYRAAVEALEKFDAIHFTESGQSCAWGSDIAYKALAALEELKKQVMK